MPRPHHTLPAASTRAALQSGGRAGALAGGCAIGPSIMPDVVLQAGGDRGTAGWMWRAEGHRFSPVSLPLRSRAKAHDINWRARSVKPAAAKFIRQSLILSNT